MKNSFLLVFTLFCCFIISAQEDKKALNERKHEIKIGGLKLIGATIFEGTYEYIQTKDFTFGASVLVDLSSENDEWYEDFSVTPFARFYFQESKEYGAKGFFVEGFGKFVLGKDYNYDYIFNSITNTYDEVEDSDKFTSGAVGLSIGKKWINNSGFVFEILVGGGRSIGGNDATPDGFFRGDFNIGYRF